jgi:hypothetical protein
MRSPTKSANRKILESVLKDASEWGSLEYECSIEIDKWEGDAAFVRTIINDHPTDESDALIKIRIVEMTTANEFIKKMAAIQFEPGVKGHKPSEILVNLVPSAIFAILYV